MAMVIWEPIVSYHHLKSETPSLIQLTRDRIQSHYRSDPPLSRLIARTFPPLRGTFQPQRIKRSPKGHRSPPAMSQKPPFASILFRSQPV